MKVTVYGVGYVGLVTGVCLAELGHDVCCMDINADKVSQLQSGQLPIYEQGLESLLHRNQSVNRIHFTTDVAHSVNYSELQIIAVGTPPQEDGSVNLSYVMNVAEVIALHCSDYKLVINKSTVPVGTAEKVASVIAQGLQARQSTVTFDVVSNPEFLKEGCAVNDFMHPDRIVVGSESDHASALMRELYASLINAGHPCLLMDRRSAELSKYVANAFLATKISFINEMSHFAEQLGADIQSIQTVLGADARISPHFLNPGCGFGGSCFPKDVAALSHLAEQLECDALMINAVLAINHKQQAVLMDKIRAYFDDDLQGKVIALWGLAFKPNTDDIREAPSRRLMELLWEAGARVQAYDPMAMPNIKALYQNQTSLQLCESYEAALNAADALAIVTEWEMFRQPDFARMKQLLRHPVIFDGRNLYDPQVMQKLGIAYYAIGRPQAKQPCVVA